MADQCIVCLENLDVEAHIAASVDVEPDVQPASPSGGEAAARGAAAAAVAEPATADPTTATSVTPMHYDHDNKIAEIHECGHVLHDACLREWTAKANSCPICRRTFHLVNVFDKVGGIKLSSYTVEDKKQVAEFDLQTWVDENPEEEEEPARPCPICNRSDHEEVLLICDSCEACYHTYCIGLDSVPRGHFFCLECAEDGAALQAAQLAAPRDPDEELVAPTDRQSDYLPRTQASMRRARRRARSDDWQGAWGQIAGRVFDALDIDLDNHDDDEALQNYRRSQRRRERERREYERWQQRLNIASRLGARDVFANNLPRVLPLPAQQPAPPSPPPPPQESPDEKQAWGALEKAIEASSSTPPTTTPNRRKRKSRSATASPREPQAEPERKLKRPRTRRVPHQTEAASSSNEQSGSTITSVAIQPTSEDGAAAPSFLSSLLKEVEMSTPSDDENVRQFFNFSKPATDHSSPATSPSPSGYSSPRALSTTPPPRGINDRPGSPLSLMSRIEPIYPPANYSPNRNGSDSESSDSRTRRRFLRRRRVEQNGGSPTPNIQHPQPRRTQQISIRTLNNPSRSPESSPTRGPLSLETKESISAIIKAALKPHYKSGNITTDQYTNINRDLSRKLYKEVAEETLTDDTRRRCEEVASKEVAKAVADLKDVKV